MSRKLLRRYLPDEAKLGKHWLLRRLGSPLRAQAIWRVNRRSVARATGLGLCVAFLPIPQMLTVALLAFPLRLNLPVALSFIFVTNPLTMAPAFYMNYRIGAWALQTPPWEAPERLTMQTLAEQWDLIWLPLYTGSLLVGATVGLLGMLLADYLWRGYARREWMRRSAAR